MIQWSEFSPKALDFIQNSYARLNILHGSVRSSKTVNCTVRWLTFLMDGPPGDLFMIGKTIATLQRNVLNDIFDMVGQSNYKWTNRQQGELRLFHRRIYCIGANNEDSESKIRGATIAGAYCDEANLYPESFWTQLMARMSVEGATCFANCNPDTPFHWFYKGYIINDAIIDKKVWHFNMDDNLSLTESYKTSLKQMFTGVFYRRFILGEWCTADGMIYDMFDPEKHCYIPEGYPHNVCRYFISCDYGTSSVMSWSLMAELVTGEIFKVSEFYYEAVKERKQLTDGQFGDKFDSWILEYPDIRKRGGVWAVYCDPSAASWKAELRFRGYNVQDADNSVINGIRVVGSMIQMHQYIIHPECKKTIEEYCSYAWDAKAQETGQDKPIKVNDHACDSDRYGVYTYTLNRMSGVYGSQ